jgi:hypothetical protein
MRLAKEAQAVFEAADQQGRSLTVDERVHVEDLLKRAKDHREMETALREIDPGGNSVRIGGGETTRGLTPGEIFTSSEGYKSALRDRGESWTTGPIDVGPIGAPDEGHAA